MRVAEQRAFGEQRACELQAQRHRTRSAFGQRGAAGDRQRRQAGQRNGDRVVVHQVHAVGIALGIEDERGRGGGRRCDDIAFRERAPEIVGDASARLLRLDVVGVVVAARERVGADEDAPLHLGTKARGARLLVHLADVGTFDAQAVTHAVETREVRRALGRRDEIIRREPVFRRRQLDFDELCTELREIGIRRFVRGGDAGREIGGCELPDDAHAHAAQIFAQMPGGCLERHVDAGRIHRVVTAHRVVRERRVFHRARERADLIEARGKRDQPVTRDAPIGRLEPDDVAERRRFANRPARIAAGGNRGYVAAHGSRAARRRAAGDAVEVVRVLGLAERRILARAAHGELVHVRFADR